MFMQIKFSDKNTKATLKLFNTKNFSSKHDECWQAHAKIHNCKANRYIFNYKSYT